MLAEASIALLGVTVGQLLDSTPVMVVSIAWVVVQLLCLRADLRVGWQILRRTLRRAQAMALIAVVAAVFLTSHATHVAAAVLTLVTASMLVRVLLIHLLRGRRRPQLMVTNSNALRGEHTLVVDKLDAATAHQVVESATRHRAREVLVDPALVSPVAMRQLSWELDETGTDLIIAMRLPGTSAHRLAIEPGGDGVRVLPGAWRSGQRAFRELLDRAAAAVLLVGLAPLLVVVAIAIRVDSKGSPLFVQTRVGRDGELFRMWKFRTMYLDADERLAQLRASREDAEAGNDVMFKMRSDPRITRLGKWLRMSSIDELLQLVNVLLGQMSLIGPRPALPREVEQYDDVARRRLVVKPGITGLWQVSGRSNLTWEQSVNLDVDYVDNWSASKDMMIALRTVKAVVSRDGAY